MFGLFKRTKIEPWETELLRTVIIRLPKEYSKLINQIDDGLLRGVLIDASDIPGYVAFIYQSDVLKKYDKINEHDFKITGIQVYDIKSATFLPYEIYVSSGTISGYSLRGNKRFKIDVNRIDVSGFRKEIIGALDYNRIESIFSEEEKRLLNPSDVYSVFVNNKEYFHVKDLEDGDFIGIDKQKLVYKITHDPLEVVLLNQTIIDVLNG